MTENDHCSYIEELIRDIEEHLGKSVNKVDFFIDKTGMRERSPSFIDVVRPAVRLINESEFEMHISSDSDHRLLLLRDPAEALRIYWQEILQRVHEANIVSMQRTLKWFDGVILGVEQANLFVFAASFRGLIESIADALDALKISNESLEMKQETIRDLLERRISYDRSLSTEVFECQYLDDRLEAALIHFSHGRDTWQEETKPPKSHKKKTFRQYAQSLDSKYSEEASAAWRELCQLAHPSLSSVEAYLTPLDNQGSKFHVGKDNDYLMILRFTYKYKKLLRNLCDDYIAGVYMSAYLLSTIPYSRKFDPQLVSIKKS